MKRQISRYIRQLKSLIGFLVFRLRSKGQEEFECPVCGYTGPFMNVASSTGIRKHAKCPACNSLERHRLQYIVVNELVSNMDLTKLSMLHFAPEPFFQEYFSKRFGRYETADISAVDVDHRVDIQQLPFEDKCYDFVFASHVLEHIPDDRKAIAEIRRVLKPNGIAILPVPIVAEKTVEYPEANPHEEFHVRAPGFDYFERFSPHFQRVEQFSSESLPEKYQLFVYEKRDQWPTEKCPLRPAMAGEKHSEIVPVCYA